jgi:hypothetical protein
MYFIMKLEKKESIEKIRISHNKKLFWIIIGLIILLICLLIYIRHLNNSAGDIQIGEINLTISCDSNNDCVGSSCCHVASCINKNYAPDCSGIRCTQECVAGTLDCQQATCKCINKKCSIVLK